MAGVRFTMLMSAAAAIAAGAATSGNAGEVADKILARGGRRGNRVELQSTGPCVIGRIDAGGGSDRSEVDSVS